MVGIVNPNIIVKSGRSHVMDVSDVEKERFHNRYSIDGSGCWIWEAAKNDLGYGQLWIEPNVEYAHRVSYVIHNGDIPARKQINHHCDNPSCVNPDHIYAGTQAENGQDGKKRGSYVTGENHPDSEITDAEIEEIRKKYESGYGSQSEIADEYGTIQSHISRIVNHEVRDSN